MQRDLNGMNFNCPTTKILVDNILYLLNCSNAYLLLTYCMCKIIIHMDMFILNLVPYVECQLLISNRNLSHCSLTTARTPILLCKTHDRENSDNTTSYHLVLSLLIRRFQY